ncbi:MAG: Protein of unknown function (DUF3417) [Candidatus Nitrotoga sp. SPKER]|nr:MAG: Protein of unknown function (DUF3417) [Candidatus Nitrotoga sp. SPKER]
MKEQTDATHSIENHPHENLEGFDALAELALAMHSSGTHGVDSIWRQLNPELWDLTHNPWAVLQTIQREKFQCELADPTFCNRIDDLVQARRASAHAPAWFQQTYPQSPLWTNVW